MPYDRSTMAVLDVKPDFYIHAVIRGKKKNLNAAQTLQTNTSITNLCVYKLEQLHICNYAYKLNLVHGANSMHTLSSKLHIMTEFASTNADVSDLYLLPSASQGISISFRRAKKDHRQCFKGSSTCH